MYDIIGDVHGYADQLKSLLAKLGYQLINGCYTHPTRKAVFVGDFINRGLKIRETIILIRRMVEAGTAYAILGNHEMYAILYYLRDTEGNIIKNGFPNINCRLIRRLMNLLPVKTNLKVT